MNNYYPDRIEESPRRTSNIENNNKYSTIKDSMISFELNHHEFDIPSGIHNGSRVEVCRQKTNMNNSDSLMQGK